MSDEQTADPPLEITRSEEVVTVGTRRTAREVVRVRKTIVTEQRTITVPVRREEISIERVAVDRDAGDNPPVAHPADGYAFTLSEEELDVRTRVVPRERVHLMIDTVTEEQAIAEEVRREHIELDSTGPL